MPPSGLPPINPERAFVDYEDLQHISKLSSGAEVTQAEIRRASVSLRRLLVYREITTSAAPFGLSLKFAAPNFQHLIKGCEEASADFFLGRCVSILGVQFAAIYTSRRNRVPAMSTFNPDNRVDWKLAAFLKQPVLLFQGQVARRGEVIEYVANKAGGAHFDPRRPGSYELIDRLRGVLTIRVQNGGPGIELHMDRVVNPSRNFVPRRGSIDPAFIDLLATCRFLSESPAVIDLQERIRLELDL